jgi:hypothetical protein
VPALDLVEDVLQALRDPPDLVRRRSLTAISFRNAPASKSP